MKTNLLLIAFAAGQNYAGRKVRWPHGGKRAVLAEIRKYRKDLREKLRDKKMAGKQLRIDWKNL